jgi:hypothetical protein
MHAHNVPSRNPLREIWLAAARLLFEQFVIRSGLAVRVPSRLRENEFDVPPRQLVSVCASSTPVCHALNQYPDYPVIKPLLRRYLGGSIVLMPAHILFICGNN